MWASNVKKITIFFFGIWTTELKAVRFEPKIFMRVFTLKPFDPKWLRNDLVYKEAMPCVTNDQCTSSNWHALPAQQGQTQKL